ncbi:PilN domain-containing protein [Gemmatimonas sp.]|uniref:PilN domain-containing protein n=1 Tax=Gemmatimonas sp. TaxID=1962908 RepID=UPI0035636A42
MMLQINLLPGSKKTSRGAGSLAGSIGAIGASVRDPWLVGAAGSVIVACAAVGLLFSAQNARAGEVTDKVDRAVRDSTRYAKVLDARRKLIAERDSVQRQLQIIRTIDENRYNWAHILDELSRALPAYTWLTTLEQTSKAPLPPGADTLAGVTTSAPVTAAAKAKQAAVVHDTIDVHPPLTFRVVGQTVDIQALTMFMRQMESSPFIQHVALTKSEIVIVESKDVTQFELSAEYEVPPPGVVRTSPLVVPVR